MKKLKFIAVLFSVPIAAVAACYIPSSKDCPTSVLVGQTRCDFIGGSIPFVQDAGPGVSGNSGATSNDRLYCTYDCGADLGYKRFYTGIFVDGPACVGTGTGTGTGTGNP